MTDMPTTPALPPRRARPHIPVPETHGQVLALFHQRAQTGHSGRFADFTPHH